MRRRGDTGMATRDDVYRKYGEASEAAQLLETELGNLLLEHDCIDAGLFKHSDPDRATAIYRRINKQTLGQLIRSLGSISELSVELDQQLDRALASRNRLTHAFFLQHNFRLNSDHGRDVMLRDLETVHEQLLEAYKAVLLLSGIDLERRAAEQKDSKLPTDHLPMPT